LRILPTRVHGVLDYVVGALLIALPWLGGFALGGAETWVPVILGALAIVYSLFTDYELGVWPRLAMSTHLALDAVHGIVFLASPWLFGFSDVVRWPFVGIGLLELAIVLVSRSTPAESHRFART
jgi:hypothetical protein